MSESDQPGEKSRIEIVGDDDWKNRVKAEDARLDAAQTEAATPPPADNNADVRLPKATFPLLVQMFSTQAIMAMGLIPGPDGNISLQPVLARHLIDLLAVLEEKTKGNLSEAEGHLIDQTLHELRMAFIELNRQSDS